MTATPLTAGHALGAVGEVEPTEFDPDAICARSTSRICPEAERARCYRETRRPDGSMLREYQIFAVDREIEIAPGLFFPAWTYNGQVPGPTIRATEGDRVRVTSRTRARTRTRCTSTAGIRRRWMARCRISRCMPGGDVRRTSSTPIRLALHLYHCHAVP